MYHSCVTWIIAAALACAVAAAQPQRAFKDTVESEIYNQVAKDIAAGDFAKALGDLELWKQKYPDSDLKQDRQLLFVQVYAGAKQPGKAIDAAADLLSRDPDAALGGVNTVKLLFTTATAIQEAPEPTSEQLATARKAGEMLLAYDKRPENVTAEAWAEARAQLQAAAKRALLHVALVPGAQAVTKGDCAAAETSLTKALEAWPDSAQAAWLLGKAQLCLYNKNQPEKASPALYAFARATVIAPSRSMVDPKWQETSARPFLENAYGQYHGADRDGLKQLLDLAAQSPFPSPGFKIKSKTEIAQEKEAEFERSNPQLALWLKIKGALADRGGEQYFSSELKDSVVPRLKGVLVAAKPACRPTELLVAVPLPESQQPLEPEILLKLEKPLAAAPQPQSELQWQGVPAAFAQNPFLLTMTVGAGGIEGLRSAPCAPAASRKAPAKKK